MHVTLRNESFKSLLSLVKVSKYYGYGYLGKTLFPAVDEVSLELGGDKPKILALVGESGCGKSTLAKIALGIVRPDRGSVLYRGRDIWKMNKAERRTFRKDVQAVFQDPYDTFNPFEKGANYLMQTAMRMLGLSKEEAVKRVDSVLRLVGLSYDFVKGKRPREFSGGQLQRIAIARALIPEPKLIIADEPVSMIDASLRVNILNIFRKIREEMKTSFLYITHDLATAYYISDEIAVMYRGTIVELGDIDKVVKNPLHPYTRTLIASLPDYRRRKVWFEEEFAPPGIEIKEFLLPGCKYVGQCPHATERCKRERPALVEVEKGHWVACWLYTKR